jgi:hypothetical protein
VPYERYGVPYGGGGYADYRGHGAPWERGGWPGAGPWEWDRWIPRYGYEPYGRDRYYGEAPWLPWIERAGYGTPYEGYGVPYGGGGYADYRGHGAPWERGGGWDGPYGRGFEGYGARYRDVAYPPAYAGWADPLAAARYPPTSGAIPWGSYLPQYANDLPYTFTGSPFNLPLYGQSFNPAGFAGMPDMDPMFAMTMRFMMMMMRAMAMFMSSA